MKKRKVIVEKNENGYALYVADNYIGTYCKTIVNIKLRAWGLPEVEI